MSALRPGAKCERSSESQGGPEQPRSLMKPWAFWPRPAAIQDHLGTSKGHRPAPRPSGRNRAHPRGPPHNRRSAAGCSAQAISMQWVPRLPQAPPQSGLGEPRRPPAPSAARCHDNGAPPPPLHARRELTGLRGSGGRRPPPPRRTASPTAGRPAQVGIERGRDEVRPGERMAWTPSPRGRPHPVSGRPSRGGSRARVFAVGGVAADAGHAGTCSSPDSPRSGPRREG